MLKSTVRLAAAAFVIAVIGAAQAKADVVVYAGTTAGGPTWNRPTPNGANPPVALSGVGTAVPYSVQYFSVDQTAAYSVQSVSTLPVGWDNFTVLYTGLFNAAMPLTNVVVANDDNPSTGQSGFTATLNAGTYYALVTTGAFNTSAGSFTNTIQGPGIVTLGIPEPSPMALAGVLGMLGLAGRTAVRRFRKSA